jgi:benzoylformate decarboxylase
MWGIQSLWTAARYNVPVTFIIVANNCYRQVRLMQNIIAGGKTTRERTLGTELCDPENDFVKLAEGMGLVGQKVKDPSELRSSLKESVEMEQPNLIEVSVDATLRPIQP